MSHEKFPLRVNDARIAQADIRSGLIAAADAGFSFYEPRFMQRAIGLLHLSDALTDGKMMTEITDLDHVLPGEGGLALVDFLNAILSTGYTGSVEVFHSKYELDEPTTVARQVFRQASRLLSTAIEEV